MVKYYIYEGDGSDLIYEDWEFIELTKKYVEKSIANMRKEREERMKKEE